MRNTLILLLLALSATISYAQIPQDAEALIAYFPFNTNANDESGHNNHGIVHGAKLTKDRFGKPYAAYQFDGINDFIEIIPTKNIDLLNDFTISAWVKFEGYKSNPSLRQHLDRQYIFNGHTHSKTTKSDFIRDGFSLMYDLMPSKAEVIRGGFIVNQEDWKDIPVAIPPKNEWHHFTYFRKSGKVYLYVDGELKNTTKVSTTPLDINHDWFIGTFSGNNPHYRKDNFNYSFKGCIDDLAIYNKAIEPKEVHDMFHYKSSQNNRNVTIYASPVPPIKEFKDTKVTYTDEKFLLKSKKVILKVWDDSRIDGDIVSIYLNDESNCIVSEYKVNKLKKEFEIELSEGLNTIIFYAVNEGRNPPNTAGLSIFDGFSEQELILKADKKTSKALKIYIEDFEKKD